MQQAPVSGEMTQKFIAFVMMQAQQISLWLGRIPHPQTGKSEVNLEAARLFIDQLEMIREKTRGNLSQEETKILSGVLSDLQMDYVKVSSEKKEAAPTEAAAAEAAAPEPEPPKIQSEEGSAGKRFSKSYGS